MKLPIFLLAILCPLLTMCQAISINGLVITEENIPIPGAAITVKASGKTTLTDIKGLFSVSVSPFTTHDARLTDTIIVTAAGYQSQYLPAPPGSSLTIILKRNITELDQAVVIAYGTTTRRFNTGTVTKITSAEINRQPVSNPVEALQGLVPGLFITQRNGLPGAAIGMLIRGRSSIQQGTVPLFIIDGIPFSSASLAQGSGTLNANNPLNTINPADIESIEILKDADATAIYGSRGANGVILITTKKGIAGKTKVDAGISNAWSTPTRTMPYMNTRQYLQVRREAFANDGITPTVANAPELLAWDTTRCIDWKNKLLGNTASWLNTQVRIAGGSSQTSFSFSAGWYRQTTVFPGRADAQRFTTTLSVAHASVDKKFAIEAMAAYSNDKSNLPKQDLWQYITMYPDAPLPYNAEGKLNWSENGIAYSNPLALLLQEYSGTTDRMAFSTTLSYRLLQGLLFKTSAGFNYLHYSEISTTPVASQNPSLNPKGAVSFGNNALQSLIIEPRLEYKKQLGKNTLRSLIGATLQREENNSDFLSATGYTNDALIRSVAGAAAVAASNNYSLYKYAGIFARLTCDWQNRYILNANARRDGSSRFGPGKQFANFWSLGAAWIFSEEQFIKKIMPFLSYGKLRGSYGITGNDQIGNYQYLDSWSNTAFPFQSVPSLRPLRLFNKDYSWEQNRKYEAAIEIGVANNRVLAAINWFCNRSDNQLISYNLPSQTGFTSIIQNFPGTVQNAGIEIEVTAQLIKASAWEWRSAFNLAKANNKLVAFPGLETSSYANSYSIGHPLSIMKGYKYLGIDPATGIYKFEDINRDGAFTAADYIVAGTTDPAYYGGWQNTVKYKAVELSVLFRFVKQQGRHAVYGSSYPVGGPVNQPVWLLDRWQKPGDMAGFQKYTTLTSSPAGIAASMMSVSSGYFTDASFIRLQNISLSYTLPQKIIQRIKGEACSVYIRAQNLLTITKYKGADPESQSFVSLPLLQTIAAGINFSF